MICALVKWGHKQSPLYDISSEDEHLRTHFRKYNTFTDTIETLMGLCCTVPYVPQLSSMPWLFMLQEYLYITHLKKLEDFDGNMLHCAISTAVVADDMVGEQQTLKIGLI